MPVSGFYRFDFVNRSEARLLATSLLLSLIRLVTWFPAAAAGPLVVPVKRCVGFVSDFKETVGRIHPCRSAWDGVRRWLGSHSRHRLRKSRKWASVQSFKTVDKSLDLGGPRILPWADRLPASSRRPLPVELTVQYRGWPLDEKNALALLLTSSRRFGGIPKISMIQASWSCSSSPGNRGNPVSSSGRIHPKLHMSIAIPYLHVLCRETK